MSFQWHSLYPGFSGLTQKPQILQCQAIVVAIWQHGGGNNEVKQMLCSWWMEMGVCYHGQTFQKKGPWALNESVDLATATTAADRGGQCCLQCHKILKSVGNYYICIIFIIQNIFIIINVVFQFRRKTYYGNSCKSFFF